MKKRLIIILASVCLLITCLPNKSYAIDLITASQVGGIAIAMMQSWGISVSGASGLTGDVLQRYMTNQVNSYVGGRSIADVFIADEIRVETGRIIIGHQLYNTVKQFIQSWLSDNDVQNIPSSTSMLSSGTLYGYPVYISDRVQVQQKVPDIVYPPYYSFFVESSAEGLSVISYFSGGRQYAQAYLNGSPFGSESYINYREGIRYYAGWTIARRPEESTCTICFIYVDNSVTPNQGIIGRMVGSLSVDSGDINVTVSEEGYTIGDDLVTGQEWGGTVDGSADTNLDQLMGTIYDDAAIDNLIIDTDTPPEPTPVPPTPVPVEPDTPLSDVPWEGLDDLIGQTEQGIKDKIQSQTQSITSAQEATTEAVESLTDTISNALDVPDAQELPDFKFDLRDLFPFCIPFDIYRLLSSFDAEPVAPHVQLPIVIESIGFSYNLDLDFSSWNPVAQAMRTAELIVYAIGLAWATGKVIKW